MTKIVERFENNKNLWRRNEQTRPFMGEHVQYIFRFDNGYGASVVKGFGTYGYEQDLWELALITFNENNSWSVEYTDRIPVLSDDVVGWLNETEVLELLDEIKNL